MADPRTKSSAIGEAALLVPEEKAVFDPTTVFQNLFIKLEEGTCTNIWGM